MPLWYAISASPEGRFYNKRNNGALYFIASPHFQTRKSPRSYARSVTNDKRVLCVVPLNEH